MMAEHTRRPSRPGAVQRDFEEKTVAKQLADLSDDVRKSVETGQRAVRKSVETGQRAARKSVEIGERAATDAARKSVEIGERAATDAVRKFVSTLEGATPAALVDSERRKTIVDAAVDWADWLVTANVLFLGGIARSASETLNERAAKPAAKGAAKPAAD
jgi:hypothetical protein